MCPEPVDAAILKGERHDPPAGSVFHDQIEGEIFDEELRRMTQRLAIERMQHGMSRAIGGRAGALGWWSLAIARRHAAEGTLINFSLFRAREGQAEMFELVHGLRRIAAQIFDRILIAEPVRALDRIVHVPAPVVGTHIAECCSDPTLCRNRVGARREDLCDASRSQTGLRRPQRSSQTRSAGAHHYDVIGMIDDRISASVDCRSLGWHEIGSGTVFGHHAPPRLSLRTA